MAQIAQDILYGFWEVLYYFWQEIYLCQCDTVIYKKYTFGLFPQFLAHSSKTLGIF